METTDYFLGGNYSDVYGDLELTIPCAEANAWKFVNFYGGCRLAQVYGDIRITIQGGTFENVFGGSKGSASTAANVRVVTQAIHDAHPTWPSAMVAILQ